MGNTDARYRSIAVPRHQLMKIGDIEFLDEGGKAIE